MVICFFFYKQKTAYELRISDWSSDVCSSDLTITDLWPSIEAALDWIDRYGDRDGDGFVEYGRKSGEGLVNQGWKDSHDSVFHADGSTARGAIALVEVQGYSYAAKCAGARMARLMGMAQKADALEPQGLNFEDRSEEHTSELQSLMRIWYA